MGNGQAKTDQSSLIMCLLGDGEPGGCGHASCSGLGSLWQLLTLSSGAENLLALPSSPGLGTLGQEGLSLQPLRGHGCGRTGVLLTSKTVASTVPQDLVTSPGSWSWKVTQAGGRTQLRSSEHPCLHQ